MVEVLGFFLVLAALALMVGTLAQGTLRVVGFVVLVMVGLIAVGPVIQRNPISGFFNGASRQTEAEEATQAPANLPSNPVEAAPAFGQPASESGNANSATSSGNSTGSSNRGIRGGW
ncbi:MAG: hypothetical protein SFY66_05030 [Oculatellaceae cyanobacterium bins.114]|nr:hypothetical protein [Oculatellaceae cyanobacterium bins.114]